MSAERLELFAVAAPGLEPLVAGELRRLGFDAAPDDGGVTFAGTLADVARANLWLRVASRVLVRAGVFHARALGELERRARQVPWERFLSTGRPVRVRATSRKSRLYHDRAVAERVANAIAERTGAVPVAGGSDEDEGDAQLVVARMLRDECTLSVDSSGALLHRRGYRLATAKAPLRETLAAALVLAGEWEPAAPLLDPFCGSGTIPIEAALLARRIPPGLARRFAFLDWPTFDAAVWRDLLDEARAGILPGAPAPILGSDRDAGAIDAARANAERAGVAADVAWRRAAVSGIEPPAGAGWVVTNPPYGKRIGERLALRDLYAQLGHVLRRRAAGWHTVLLSPAAPLERETGLAFRELFRSNNGGLLVRALESKSDLRVTVG